MKCVVHICTVTCGHAVCVAGMCVCVCVCVWCEGMYLTRR